MVVIQEASESADRSSVASEDFKLGMRRLVASVCLITAGEPGDRVGLTATAVCSVSAEPPTLLCCVNRSSASYAKIIGSGSFAVNVIAKTDAALADRFSSRLRSEEKFEEGDWFHACSPILRSASVSFGCDLQYHMEAGTHGIILGRVCDVFLGEHEISPLLYAYGRYAEFLIS